MTARTLKRIALLGLLLFVVGTLWGIYFVGVPYQDPTPGQTASEKLHLSVSSWLMAIGLCTFLASGALAVARFILNQSRRRTAP